MRRCRACRPAHLEAIERAVDAVVGHDEGALAAFVPAGADLFLWTRDYGQYRAVDLIRPPGPASAWDIDAVEVADIHRGSMWWWGCGPHV